MRKDISPEMYNYNKFPGPQFVSVETQVKSDGINFIILENEKNAFDVTVFNQRFSEILLKYDYIVGDWGNEQLRLKGFYKDDKGVKKISRISRLDDYIKEYCNFGCAYFILENPNPREIKFEEEKTPRRRKSSRKYSNNQNREEIKDKQVKQDKPQKQHFTSQKRKTTKSPNDSNKKSEQKKETQNTTQHFVIRKKER